jgi:hypothetical protein
LVRIWVGLLPPLVRRCRTRPRVHPDLLPALALAQAKADGLPTLSDLGYEGEADTVRIPAKTPAGRTLTDQKTYNRLHAAIRSQAERANAQLKMRFKALRRVSLCPWRIGHITAAALMLFHPRRAAPPDARSPTATARYSEYLSGPAIAPQSH